MGLQADASARWRVDEVDLQADAGAIGFASLRPQAG